ncbi:MerC domain-containing protein [Aquimarina addita]|uniref:MerC domain-containing protein n=1 Tax=Aquimarina addita TaxID=870485 RepID=UPI0031EF1E20
MKVVTRLSESHDMLDRFASGLCLTYCVATPFLLTTHAGHKQLHPSNPLWWGTPDLILIAVAFIAVFWSFHHTTKQWIPRAFWLSWILMFVFILNEKSGFSYIIETTIYIPSIALVALYIYNHNYYKCTNKNCYTHAPNANI